MKRTADLLKIARECKRRDDVAAILSTRRGVAAITPYWSAAEWIYDLQAQIEGMAVEAKRQGVVLSAEGIPTSLQRRVAELESEILQRMGGKP